MRGAMFAGLLAASLLPGAAQAAMTDTDAATLRTQLQTWLATWSFGIIEPKTLPLTVTAEADHLLLRLPFGGMLADRSLKLSDGALTVQMHPLDAGRWSIDRAGLPAAVTLNWSGKGKSATAMSVGRHEITGVFDPALATESKLDVALSDYTVTVTEPKGAQRTSIAKLTSHNLWTPTAEGRVAMTDDTVLEGYALSDTASGPMPVKATVQRIRIRSLLDDVDFARLGEALRVLSVAKELDQPKRGKSKTLTPADRATLHAAIDAFATVLGGADSQQVWEGIQFSVGDQQGSLKRLALGFAATAPGGLVSLKLPVAVEGFDSPAIADPAMREMLPHSLAFTPRLSGLSRQALLDALHRMVDLGNDDPDLPAEAATILAAGKVALGIDDLAVDVGPMRVKGAGQLLATSTEDFTGDAVLRATGMDALIKRTNTVPALKLATPFLIFLKGIAEADGAQLVWNITYADGDLAVNGTSLSDLTLPGK